MSTKKSATKTTQSVKLRVKIGPKYLYLHNECNDDGVPLVSVGPSGAKRDVKTFVTSLPKNLRRKTRKALAEADPKLIHFTLPDQFERTYGYTLRADQERQADLELRSMLACRLA